MVQPSYDEMLKAETPSLHKRKDFIGVDSEAANHPTRTYYYKKTGADFDEIIAACTRKLEQAPDHLKALYLRGSAYYKKRSYNDAIADLNRALQLDPSHEECLYYRGLAHSKVNNQEQAITDYSSVLRLNPNHVNAAFARASNDVQSLSLPLSSTE